LRARLPLTRPEGTVRWHTPGLDLAIASRDAGAAGGRLRPDGGCRIMRTGGLHAYAATADVLRKWAVNIYRLGSPIYGGMDYVFLDAGPRRTGDGEVQVFTDYRRRVSAARAARCEILNEIPDGLPQPLPPADIDPLIWELGMSIRRNTRPRSLPS
jgi:hypothetical protein